MPRHGPARAQDGDLPIVVVEGPRRRGPLEIIDPSGKCITWEMPNTAEIAALSWPAFVLLAKRPNRAVS